jgi:transposase
MEILNLISLISAEKKSKVYFRHLRWQGKRYCPYCQKKKIYRLANEKFRCASCRHKFSEFTGTYLSGIRIPFNHLLYLLHLFVLGIPAYRVAKNLNLSIDTVGRLFLKLREAIYENSLSELKQLSGELELDETMFGGRRAGKRGWEAEGKQIVFGIYQRDGKIIVFPVPNRDRKTLLPLIKEHTQKGSIYYTDEYRAYVSLIYRGKHIRITKEKGKPVKEQNLNGLEGFWSYAKNWLYQYRGVPRRYFHLYLKEIEFRFNNRQKDLLKEIVKLLCRERKFLPWKFSRKPTKKLKLSIEITPNLVP